MINKTIHHLFRVLIIPIFILNITACNNDIDMNSNNYDEDYIESGFDIGSGCEFGWLATAVKASKNQHKNSKLDVSLGYYAGFVDRLQNGAFNFTPSEDTFRLFLSVRNNDDDELMTHNYKLDSFYNEEKYAYTNGISRRSFKCNMTIELDFNLINLGIGYILFYISNVDENLKIIDLGCGSNDSYVYFKAEDESVYFSNIKFND